MDVHSKASLCDPNSPTAVADLGRDNASISKQLTEDVVIVVDDEVDFDHVDIESSTDRKGIAKRKPSAAAAAGDVIVVASSSVADRSSESVESSSLATSTSERPHHQHRRRFSNLSNLAHSLPSATLSNSVTGGGFSGAAASTTTGGSLDHVSGVRKRKGMSGGGSRSRGGSNRNSSDSGRVRPNYSAAESASNVMDEGGQVQVLGAEVQGGVRRTRSALETTRGTMAGAATVELVAGDCDSLSEEITSKSPLLVQLEIPVEDYSQPREKKRDTASPTQLISLPGRTFFVCVFVFYREEKRIKMFSHAT